MTQWTMLDYFLPVRCFGDVLKMRLGVLLGLFAVTAATFSVGPTVANDDARCVQQMLADAYYDVGTIDGQVGAKTRRAAEALVREYPDLRLPAFEPASYAAWCSAAQGQPFKDVLKKRELLGLVVWRDLEGPTAFWRAYEKVKVCGATQRGGKFDPLPARDLAPFDPSMISRLKPIFPSAENSPSCLEPAYYAERFLSPDEPVVDAEITGDYHGCDFCQFRATYQFLGPAIAAYRAHPSEEAAAPLRKFLVDWAEADALSKNIWAPWEPHPIDYNVLKIIPPVIIAYSEVGASMSPADAETVGRWIHRLVGETMKSKWGDRQDGKSYTRVYVGLLWGIVTGDQTLKDIAYQVFDEALYDLRPDGSPPVESQRGGSGLHYANSNTRVLTAIATAAAAEGVNLFEREVNERSLAAAANWVGVAADFPSLNMRYARSCPDGGDGPGHDSENPSLDYMLDGQFASWAAGYILSPDADPITRELLRRHLPTGSDMADIHASGSLACYAAGIFGEAPDPETTNTDFDGYACKFELTSIVDRVDRLATGTATIEGGQLRFTEVNWRAGLRPRGETWANWPLTFGKDGSLRGRLPVYFLYDNDDPPIIGHVGSLTSNVGKSPSGANATFFIDRTDNNIGTLKLSACKR